MAGSLADDARLWIPDDTYELRYLDYSTVLMFNAPKLVLRFEVVSHGTYKGTQLAKWYRVRKLKGRPKKRGDFVVGSSSEYFRDYCRLIGPPARNDRLSMVALKHKIVLGKTRTVTVDSRQRALPEGARYSVLEDLKLA